MVEQLKRLMELHIDYEKQKEYPLEQIEDAKAEVSFRAERMKLSKDKTELRYNDFLLLRGTPPQHTTTVSATAPPSTPDMQPSTPLPHACPTTASCPCSP